jgi:hypothetical protein
MPDQNIASYTEEVIQDLRALKIPRHRRRRIWKPFMEKYNCQVICEIGVQEGRHFKLMIEHNPKIAVAVDPWFDNGTVSQNGSGYSQKALDDQYLYLKELANQKPFIQVVRECSVDAAMHYPEEFFDFVVQSPFLRADKFLSQDKEYENFTLQEFDRYLTIKNITKRNSKHIDINLLGKFFPNIDFNKAPEPKQKGRKKKET